MYVSVALVTFILFETKWGLRVRAVGDLQKIPSELLGMTPYIATVIAVAGFVGRVPAADGQPYVKG